MRKWLWSLILALIVWGVSLKFSPEETILGSSGQIRYELLTLVCGGFIGLMFGLVATTAGTIIEERLKVLYSILGWTTVGLLLTWGANIIQVVFGLLAGIVIGSIIGTLNYFARRRALASQK
jgi:hypothetical protein